MRSSIAVGSVFFGTLLSAPDASAQQSCKRLYEYWDIIELKCVSIGRACTGEVAKGNCLTQMCSSSSNEVRSKDAPYGCKCAPGYEKVNGACVAACPGARNAAGACTCAATLDLVVLGGVNQCLPKCTVDKERVGDKCLFKCAPVNQRVGENCVPRCAADEQVVAGLCKKVCDANNDLIGGRCFPKCQPDQFRSNVDNTCNCKSADMKLSQGKCACRDVTKFKRTDGATSKCVACAAPNKWNATTMVCGK